MSNYKPEPKELFELIEASRRALLKYYNSQTMTHGGYTIALVIGILTVVSRWTTFAENFIMWYLFLFLLIVFFPVSGIYVIGRTIFWGYHAHEVLKVKRSEIELDVKSMDDERIMYQVHLKAYNQAKDIHLIAKHFYSSIPALIFSIEVCLILWVPSLVYLIFYCIPSIQN